MPRPHWTPALCGWLAVALIAGCTPRPGATGAGGRKTPGATGLATAVTPPAITPTGTTGAGIVSNNASSLAGRVLVPDGLVSDHGGGLIANNGGGLVSKTKLRLLATVAQSPLAGAEVRLLDAAGKAIAGPDGQPLVAVTDAQGAYAFTAALPTRNLVVTVALPASKGAVKAVVPREGTGAKVVDVDLVSTLTTGYILDQYVVSQADPLATLEKLPASVEKETREKALAALTGGSVAVPDTLTNQAVVAAVDALRKGDPTFDQQLTYVKSLLVVAGASELGTGLPATTVTMKGVDDLVCLKDGTMGLMTTEDDRVWRLRTDGILETWVGDRRPPGTADLTGSLGAEASLDHPTQLSLDSQDRLLIAEARGVYRLEADGKLKRLSTLKSAGMVAGTGDEVVVAVLEPPDDSVLPTEGPAAFLQYGFYRCRPGKAPERFLEQLQDPNDDGSPMVWLRGMAWDGGHTLYISYDNQSSGKWELVAYDFDTKRTTTQVPSANNGQTWLDGAGRLIYQDATGELHAKTLYSQSAEIALPAPPQWSNQLRVAPDGHAYAAKFGAVYRLDAGGPVRVAGTEGHQASGDATAFTFEVLGDCAVTPSGDVYALDLGKGSVYKVDAQKQITRVADMGRGNVQILRTDATGNLTMSDGNGAKVGRFDTDGVWTAVYDLPSLLTDYAIAADGTLYGMSWDTTDRQYHLNRVKDGVTTSLDVAATGQILALDAAGTLWVAGGGTLRKWDGSALTVIATDDHFSFTRALANGVGMTFDAKGRVYVADPARTTIFRYEPATKAFDDVAGPGAPHFSGSGTDDGINAPRTPRFDGAGNFYFADSGNRQVKRIPASEL